jgi:hypothetical protein
VVKKVVNRNREALFVSGDCFPLVVANLEGAVATGVVEAERHRCLRWQVWLHQIAEPVVLGKRLVLYELGFPGIEALRLE